MAQAGYERWSAAGWRGHKDRGWTWDGRGDPLALLSSANELRQLRDVAARRVWRLEHDGERIYLKHIRGPKDRMPEQLGVLAWLKWRVMGSRAQSVRRVHVRMQRAGLRVPRVLLAASRRGETGREDLLVTRGDEGPPLSRVLRVEDRDRRRRALAQAGAGLAALHRAGFVHGDPTPANMLVPEDAEACWLDNDRTRRWWLPPAMLRRRNLAKLARRALIQAPWREVKVLLEAYRSEAGIADDARWRRQRLRIIRQIRRNERYGKRTRLKGAARP